MRRLRKCLISIFVLIPLASISFASEKEIVFDGSIDLDMAKLEKDFIVKMASENLPNSYYQILAKYGIDSVGTFLMPENKQFKEDLLDKYAEEILMKTGGGGQSWGY